MNRQLVHHLMHLKYLFKFFFFNHIPACTDKHCIHMVQKGVGKKLLRLVAKNNSASEDIRLQHALLSALR
jgi:hypothetical protein